MEFEARFPSSRSVPEVAMAHGVSVPTIWRAIARGDLKVHKLGRRTLVLIDDERAWLVSLAQARGQGEAA